MNRNPGSILDLWYSLSLLSLNLDWSKMDKASCLYSANCALSPSGGWRASPNLAQVRVLPGATLLSLFTFMHWRRKWQPTPVFLPGESHGRGSLVGCLGSHRVGHGWSNLAAAAGFRNQQYVFGGTRIDEKICFISELIILRRWKFWMNVMYKDALYKNIYNTWKHGKQLKYWKMVLRNGIFAAISVNKGCHCY